MPFLSRYDCSFPTHTFFEERTVIPSGVIASVSIHDHRACSLIAPKPLHNVKLKVENDVVENSIYSSIDQRTYVYIGV